MQVSRCVSCMGETGGYPCPHCGFDAGAQPQPGYALPRNTILHGKYLVGRVLGQGGFGITYVGWDLALEVKVAIKEYYPAGQAVRQSSAGSKLQWSGAQSENARRTGMESFLKEARKMARVDRVPQVVRVRDTFYDNDTTYIIMDFVDGETLKARLEREGPLPFDRAMEVFRPAIAAMEEVHKAGLIHRDLSPDNIMLEPGGGVRILDLGAAKDLAVNRGATSMLVTKGGFSPLEQYSQRGGSGPWTDVYAMAATIYYTLTGVLPPNAIDRLDDDELRWDLPALASMGAPAREALQKALAVAAKNRTQSMAGLLAGLEQAGPTPEQNPGQPKYAFLAEPAPPPEPRPEPEPQPEPAAPQGKTGDAPPEQEPHRPKYAFLAESAPPPEPRPKPESQPEPAAPWGETGDAPERLSGEGSNSVRRTSDLFTAFLTASGALLASIAWAAFYGGATYQTVVTMRPFGVVPPLGGGILVAAGLWFALRPSPRMSARKAAILSALAGGAAAFWIWSIRDPRRLRPTVLPIFFIGGLLGAICTWIILKKKKSSLSNRAIAAAGVIAGIVLPVSLKVQTDQGFYWWWTMNGDFMPSVCFVFVVTEAVLVVGIWLVLRLCRKRK